MKFFPLGPIFKALNWVQNVSNWSEKTKSTQFFKIDRWASIFFNHQENFITNNIKMGHFWLGVTEKKLFGILYTYVHK